MQKWAMAYHCTVMACKTLRFFLPELAIWNDRTEGRYSQKFQIPLAVTRNYLITIAHFCLKVYFPCWFLLKLHSKCTEGPKHYFYMVKLARVFPIKGASDLAFTNLGYYSKLTDIGRIQWSFWLWMLGDDDVDSRDGVVGLILKWRWVTYSPDGELPILSTISSLHPPTT